MDKGRHYRNRRHLDDGDLLRTVAWTPVFLPSQSSVHRSNLSFYASIQHTKLKRHCRSGINADLFSLCVACFSRSERKSCFADEHFQALPYFWLLLQCVLPASKRCCAVAYLFCFLRTELIFLHILFRKHKKKEQRTNNVWENHIWKITGFFFISSTQTDCFLIDLGGNAF